MEHNYDINVSSEEVGVIYKFLSQDLSVSEDYCRQYVDDKTAYYGYEYNRKVEYHGRSYIVNLRLCDNQEGRSIRCLRILENDTYHYINLNSHKDIEDIILHLLPPIINPRKLDNYNINLILENKRFNDLDNIEDNPCFVKEYYHDEWLYHAEYESIKLQLMRYLETNKEKLTSEEIKTIEYYIDKFKNNDKVIYEREFNFYFNGKDHSTLEKVFVKR